MRDRSSFIKKSKMKLWTSPILCSTQSKTDLEYFSNKKRPGKGQKITFITRIIYSHANIVEAERIQVISRTKRTKISPQQHMNKVPRDLEKFPKIAGSHSGKHQTIQRLSRLKEKHFKIRKI